MASSQISTFISYSSHIPDKHSPDDNRRYATRILPIRSASPFILKYARRASLFLQRICPAALPDRVALQTIRARSKWIVAFLQ